MSTIPTILCCIFVRILHKMCLDRIPSTDKYCTVHAHIVVRYKVQEKKSNVKKSNDKCQTIEAFSTFKRFCSWLEISKKKKKNLSSKELETILIFRRCDTYHHPGIRTSKERALNTYANCICQKFNEKCNAELYFVYSHRINSYIYQVKLNDYCHGSIYQANL